MACLKDLPSPRSVAVRTWLEPASPAEEADARFRGGRRRRAGTARALLNDPELLIVDEATVIPDPKE